MQPGQQKITQFDEVTSTQSGDVIPIVRGGQNKKISVENFTGVLPEGWLTPAEAWTFSSFGSSVGVITIPEGNIDRYPNGTRVWFKQGTPTPTNRYGIVIASTTTTLTLSMVGGTVLSNLAIQQPAISSEVAPRTPENVNWTTRGSKVIKNSSGFGVTSNVMSDKVTGTLDAGTYIAIASAIFVSGNTSASGECNIRVRYGASSYAAAVTAMMPDTTAKYNSATAIVQDTIVIESDATPVALQASVNWPARGTFTVAAHCASVSFVRIA